MVCGEGDDRVGVLGDVQCENLGDGACPVVAPVVMVGHVSYSVELQIVTSQAKGGGVLWERNGC